MSGVLHRITDETFARSLLRRVDDFGLEAFDLVRSSTRFWLDYDSPPVQVRTQIDSARVEPVRMPSALLRSVPEGESVLGVTRRSLHALRAWFLIAEDPQRRLEDRKVASLAHQTSLVRHVLESPNLQRVLIADEVGLGKTIEAGLIIQGLLTARPGLRILYLAPARLVRNVKREFENLGLEFRLWVAGPDSTATLEDPRIIASIHRASLGTYLERFKAARPWDVIIVDECHHLSDWAPGGGKPTQKYTLVRELKQRMGPSGRLILLSGTPHQGHVSRFDNLVELLRAENEPKKAVEGRVIYRTKDDVSDWDGRPLFPRRDVRAPTVVDLGSAHRSWLKQIKALYSESTTTGGQAHQRAAGWRSLLALQWATSSLEAGLGFMLRQALRADWPHDDPDLLEAASRLRPYRQGPRDEDPRALVSRICREIDIKEEDAFEDLEEDLDEEDSTWRPDPARLREIIRWGIELLEKQPNQKWNDLFERILRDAGTQKVVLFAQPIETVMSLCRYLEGRTGRAPALIIGGQDEADRDAAIRAFWRDDGPQYLVSSRAGGEGLNLQIARRLVHVDVPWNPMELEQRVGRVHRFRSRQTIIVDTLVVKESRECDAYRIARDKLKEIARTMVSEDRFEDLFGRVMALVPPNELESLIGQQALAPFTDDESSELARLVREGFVRWQQFHENYAASRRRLENLDPGAASWSDIQAFAKQHLGAKPALGFSALRFRWREGEVVDASESADVLEIDGRPYACGDFGGMPVTSASGETAQLLGLNLLFMVRQLREIGTPREACGAAHLRWPEEVALPTACAAPFGLIVLVRQSLRVEGASYVEQATQMHAWIVGSGQSTMELGDGEKARVIRALLQASARRDPELDESLLERIAEEELRLCQELQRPSGEDRDHGVRHVVFPVLAATVV